MEQKSYKLDKLEIVCELLNRENHVRGLAKGLGTNHMTVSRKIMGLLEENVVDYRMEGKNKVFFIKKNLQAKNYVLSAERYKFVKLLKAYPELGVIMDGVLRKAAGEKLVVLFGSYAKFSAGKGSDIDIYVETESRRVKEGIEFVHSKIRVKIGGFDLDSNLIKEIIKSHVILKGAEDFYEKTRFFG